MYFCASVEFAPEWMKKAAHLMLLFPLGSLPMHSEGLLIPSSAHEELDPHETAEQKESHDCNCSTNEQTAD